MIRVQRSDDRVSFEASRKANGSGEDAGFRTGCKPRTFSGPDSVGGPSGLGSVLSRSTFCHDLLRNARSPKHICTYPVILRSRGAFGGAFLPAKYGMDVVKVRHRRPESLEKPAKCCDLRSPWSEWGSGGRRFESGRPDSRKPLYYMQLRNERSLNGRSFFVLVCQ